MKRLTVVCAIVAIALVVGCGSQDAQNGGQPSPVSETTTAEASRELQGYLADALDGVMFVQWAESGDALSGTIYLWTPPKQDFPDDTLNPFETFRRSDDRNTAYVSFTGTRSGGQLTVTVPQGFGVSTTLLGEFGDSTLTLFFPDEFGTITPVEFQEATIDQYNEAVISLQAQEAGMPEPLPSDPAFQAEAATTADEGYTIYDGSTFRSDGKLHVLIGIRTGSVDGYNKFAFFFVDGRYLGTDTLEPSAVVEVVSQQDDLVILRYALYRPDDPMCCPTGGDALVRFRWDGQHLTPLDPIPSNDWDAPLSRR